MVIAINYVKCYPPIFSTESVDRSREWFRTSRKIEFCIYAAGSQRIKITQSRAAGIAKSENSKGIKV